MKKKFCGIKDGKDGSYERWATTHRQPSGLTRSYHNVLLFAKLKRKHAKKNSYSSKDETNYINFVQGQQLLVSPEFWTGGAGRGHCFSQIISSNCAALNSWPKQSCARQFKVCPLRALALHQSVNLVQCFCPFE